MEKRKYKPILSMNGVRIHLPVWVAKTKEILFVLGVGIIIFVLGIIFGISLKVFF